MGKKFKYILFVVSMIFLLLISAFTFDPVANVNITEEWMAAAVGLVLTLLFSFFPGLNTWYAEKSENYKKMFMAGVLFVTLAAVFGGACLGLLSGIECTLAGGWQILQLYVIAVVVNQSVFKITPVTSGVALAKRLPK